MDPLVLDEHGCPVASLTTGNLYIAGGQKMENKIILSEL